MATDAMEKIVEQLIDRHIRLAELAKKKTEAIKEGDVRAVECLTKEELSQIDQIRALEAERAEQVGRTTAGLDDRGEAWTFKKWVSRVVPEDERGKWKQLYDRLVRAIDALKQINKLNQLMLVQSLRRVELDIQLLQPHRQPAYGYGHNGQKQSAAFIGRIDSRA